MTETQRVVLLVAVVGVLFLTAGAGTVAAQSAPDCSTVSYNGDGTDTNPYEVGNVDQLQCIEEQDLDANYVQVSDIDASGTKQWNKENEFTESFGGSISRGDQVNLPRTPVAEILNTEGVNISLVDPENGTIRFQEDVSSFFRVTYRTEDEIPLGLEPIGEFNRTRDTEFNGTFVGADHTISGLKIDRVTTDGVGLFGGVETGSRLENVALENVNISGFFTVGGLVGWNTGGTVRESYATGDVSGHTNAGGLVGNNDGNVTDSYVTGDVSVVDERVGGLVGENGGNVTESYATGDVSGSTDDVGGLVGFNEAGGTVRESYATGDVSGESSVGGLVGNNAEPQPRLPPAKVTESYATGDVSGNDEVGGLVGGNNGNVRESYANGTVSGNDHVGGLVGRNDPDATVRESYATGNVSGFSGVGGLVGRNRDSDFGTPGTVERSYATGSVSGNRYVGGLLGRNSEATVRESYATGDVSGNDFVGGLVGLKEGDSTVENSYWDTETTGQPGSDGGTGLITSEMTGSSATNNMLGFDFTSTWKTVTNPDDYPLLAFQSQPDPAPPNFEVSIDSTNSPVEEGETLNITGTIENTGGQQDTQTITATASGLGSITRQVTLDGGESETERVPIPTSTGDAGTYTVTVESENDTTTTSVVVESDGGDDTFTEPLPGFNNPPQNTGDLDPTLYEDVDGDGDGTDPTQAVTLWTELVLNPQDFDDLTQEQIDALDWNGDGQLTPADAVSLWTEQVLA